MHEMLTGIGTSVATLGSMVVLGYLSLALFAVVTGRPVLSPAWRPRALIRRSGLYHRRQVRLLRRQVDEAFSEAEAEIRQIADVEKRRDWL
jgi:hypothetical protein